MEDLASLMADNLMGTGFVAVVPSQELLTDTTTSHIMSVVAARMAHVFTVEASSSADLFVFFFFFALFFFFFFSFSFFALFFFFFALFVFFSLSTLPSSLCLHCFFVAN